MKIPLEQRKLPKGTIKKLSAMILKKLLADKAKKEGLNKPIKH